MRFAASKLAEGDVLIRDSLKLDENEKETLEHIICQMEAERGLDRAAAIAHMRFDFIEKVCDETVIRPKESKEHIRSQKIDRILTGKYTALPCFCLLYTSSVRDCFFIILEVNWGCTDFCLTTARALCCWSFPER